MKRWLALLVALALLLSTALAEEPSTAELLALADAAAIIPTTATSELPYCGLSLMALDWSEDRDAVRLLGDLYLAPDQLDRLTVAQCAQVQWLDQRAVVELRQLDGVWQVTSFSLETEWEMEQLAQAYFNTTMVEYAADGFSVQYPSLFTEDSVTLAESGISGSIQGASFLVQQLDNPGALTTQAILSAKKQETPGAETNMDDYTGVGSLKANANGECLVYMVLATEDSIYQAELRYDESLIKDFMRYGDYMLNSFSVSEAGNG